MTNLSILKAMLASLEVILATIYLYAKMQITT